MSHTRSSSISLFSLITILVICYHLQCEARDSINKRNPLSYSSDDTLVSAGKIFELGFFTPEGKERSNRYIGIWYYNVTPRVIVWVANRNTPLHNSCGELGIAEDGNLKIFCSNGDSLAITNVESFRISRRTLQLLDTGNLILVDGQSSTGLWQSFDHPTDTLLPGMKLDNNVELISWINPSDPHEGNYRFRQDQGGYSIQKGSENYWKSGELGTSIIEDVLPPFVNQILSGSKSFSYSNPSNSYYSRLVMNSSGMIQYFHKFAADKSWSLLWSEPQNLCSVYKVCGKFAVCNVEKEAMCKCPRGFEPASPEDWMAKQYSEGCERKSKTCSEKREFFELPSMQVLGVVTRYDLNQTKEGCRKACLNSCYCEAYSYIDIDVTGRETGESATKCWIWNDIINLHQDNTVTAGRIHFFIRVPSLSTALANPGIGSQAPDKNKSRKKYVIIIIVLVAGVMLVSGSSYILYKRRRMAQRPGRRGSTQGSSVPFSNESERQVNELMLENEKRIDVPFYNLELILSATDNFSDANKLGQGGFGPVYKGMFPGGHEIAVKRLSSFSGQGIEEFLNEVVLIAKLQHRNLVRLLGYCIKKNEKILLYEYMPNRSLDAFIFDQHKCLLLDWKKRFEIILGIARGLQYLHHDSRLRIIHRDLKTSNILLDEDMNPKISDFGLARIVEGKGTEASTNKIVGTYGYMSPEYALEGKFSIKSDVFSFGVVMLEIVSGKKNTGFYNPKEVLNLLGYTWRLWSENKALDLVDPTLLESCEKSQVMKCINIGLLCVQEDPNDRPSMSTVVIMLGSETTLPLPTRPAFVIRRRLSSTPSSSSTKPDSITNNEMTISLAQGR